MNKLQAVREVVKELGPQAKPKEIQQYLLQNRRLRIDLPLISNYKGKVVRENGAITKSRWSQFTNQARPEVRVEVATNRAAQTQTRADHDPSSDSYALAEIAAVAELGEMRARALVAAIWPC
jgi:hypothetical protein